MTVGHTLWSDQLSASERAALDPGSEAGLNRAPDVLVVGGGMLGVATAFACASVGLGSVVLLERATLAAGASGGAAGQLLPEAHIGVDPPELVDLGRKSLADWRELHNRVPGGLDLIDLDWLGIGPAAERFGETLPANATRLTADEVSTLIPGLRELTVGVLVREQARLNPVRTIARLAAAFPRPRTQVATRVEVQDVRVHGDRITRVDTTVGEFTPGNVVFAMGMPPRFDALDLRLPASEVKGHIVVSEPMTLRLPGAVEPLATSVEDGRLLVGGSLDVGDEEWVVRPEIIAAQCAELGAAWPAARGVRVAYGWACFRPAHPDRLPVIDRVPGVNNAWITSGHYRTGILMAPATGNALASWIRSGTGPDEVQAFAAGRLIAASR